VPRTARTGAARRGCRLQTPAARARPTARPSGPAPRAPPPPVRVGGSGRERAGARLGGLGSMGACWGMLEERAGARIGACKSVQGWGPHNHNLQHRTITHFRTAQSHTSAPHNHTLQHQTPCASVPHLHVLQQPLVPRSKARVQGAQLAPHGGHLRGHMTVHVQLSLTVLKVMTVYVQLCSLMCLLRKLSSPRIAATCVARLQSMFS